MYRVTHAVIALLSLLTVGNAVSQDAGVPDEIDSRVFLYEAAIDDIDLTVPPSSREKSLDCLEVAKDDPLAITSTRLKSCYAFLPKSAQLYVAMQIHDAMSDAIESGREDQVDRSLTHYLRIVKLFPELSYADFWILTKYGRPDIRNLEHFAMASTRHDRQTPFKVVQTVLEYPSLRERLEKHREVMSEPGYDARVKANAEAARKAKVESERLRRIESLRLRTWTSKSGEHTTEGEFHSFIDGVVTITKPDLSQVEVRLRYLSSEDQQFIRDKIKNGQAVQKD
jgi:hypothetical protein